jgi:hypothetical protein
MGFYFEVGPLRSQFQMKTTTSLIETFDIECWTKIDNSLIAITVRLECGIHRKLLFWFVFEFIMFNAT